MIINERALWRGKQIYNGEWVYGYLEFDFPGRYLIHKKDGWRNEVDPDTIGQYAMICDKRGTKIFEGDIIRLTTADCEQITITCKFGTIRRQIFENEVEITGFYFVRSNDGRKTFPITHNYLGKHDTELWEVVGNVADNPELLTGGERNG